MHAKAKQARITQNVFYSSGSSNHFFTACLTDLLGKQTLIQKGYSKVSVWVVLAIKLIGVVDKVNEVVDNVENKVNSFNGALNVLNKAADGIANISDSVVFGITSTISKIFNRSRKNKDEEDLL